MWRAVQFMTQKCRLVLPYQAMGMILVCIMQVC